LDTVKRYIGFNFLAWMLSSAGKNCRV